MRASEPVNALVSHYNIRPTVDIYATTQGRDLGAVAADIEKLIEETKAELPKGATVTTRGQIVTMESAYGQLFFGLGFAIVLIYLLIVVNFQSWLDPFIIVLALPAALAGIVWMLFLTHTTLSALTGAIMSMGVATANSILVTSFAREQLAEGKDAMTAALAAGATRFRPVLMTAFAMIIGMLPMAIEPERAAWPRRHRWTYVRHLCDLASRAGTLQHSARARAVRKNSGDAAFQRFPGLKWSENDPQIHSWRRAPAAPLNRHHCSRRRDRSCRLRHCRSRKKQARDPDLDE
jgi:hypothetical protein